MAAESAVSPVAESKPASSPAPERVVDLEERAWLARHRRGDPSAFRELLAALQSPVYSFITRCGIRGAARDDLFQEIFIKVHLSADAYDRRRPLKPWIFTIAANTVRNHVRDERRRSGPIELDYPESVPAIDETVERERTLEWLQHAIASLPIAQREVLVLTTIEGLKQGDVAGALGIPLGTVKTRLHRARLSLTRALAERTREVQGC